MMATTNSRDSAAQNLPQMLGVRRARRAYLRLLYSILAMVLSALALLVPVALAESKSSADNSPAAHAQRNYFASKVRWARNAQDAEAAWQFGRACFDWGEFVGSDSQRAEVAEQGIEACRQAIRLKPKLGAAHYYLALNLGQLARTRTLGALKLVSEMEQVFKTAISLDPAFDYAGPHRSLGLLYRDAPGWPASIGNRGKARQHLQKAVELSSEYPDNHLSLLEAYLEWTEKKNAQAALPAAEHVLQIARQKLTGEEWKMSWQDWDRRWEKIKAKTAAASSESSRFKK